MMSCISAIYQNNSFSKKIEISKSYMQQIPDFQDLGYIVEITKPGRKKMFRPYTISCVYQNVLRMDSSAG
jgi:hypothetical protein